MYQVLTILNNFNSEILSFDVEIFIRHLMKCVTHPKHLEVYLMAKKILQPNHQLKFAKDVPTVSVHKIYLDITSSKEMGFSICGGRDVGLEIYVNEINFQKVRKSIINTVKLRF
jgi:hypothetical protein